MNTLQKKNTMRFICRKMGSRLVLTWIVAFLILPSVMSSRITPVLAQADLGTIAYVRTSGAIGDEIRLIEPDGSGDRRIWNTGVPIVENMGQISGLAWNPAASDLAFAAQHEEACSLYNSDIYTIHADGSGYRRVTVGPACGQAAGLPKGTVILPIVNETGTGGPFVVYFQGASNPTTITLAPGAAATVTFTNVADYGNFKQWGVVVFGEERFFTVTGNADVVAGKSVTSGTLYMYEAYTQWGFRWPTWTEDGNQIAYVFDGDTPYWIDFTDTRPGIVGALTFNVPIGSYPYSSKHYTWAPPGPHANQVLYSAWDQWYEHSWIYLGSAQTDSPGEALFSTDDGYGHSILGLAWLPDSSGFLYTKTEGFGYTANIYEYLFATDESTQLTDFTSGYPRRLSVSPDGTQVVYEYQAEGDWADLFIATDLWMLDMDTGEANLVVENGRAPAWSLQAISNPVPDPDPTPVPPADLGNRVFIPMTIRK